MVFERIKDCMSVHGYTNPDYLELLYRVCLDTDVKGETIEIGCFMGRSTLALSRALEDRRMAEVLHVLDCFAAPPEDPHLKKALQTIYKPEERFLDNMKKHGAHNITLIAADSQSEKAWDTLPGTLRFAHIDGDHSYEGAKNDIERVLERLSKGGVVAVDDYHDRNWDWGVKRAVDELLMPRSGRTWRTESGEQILVEVIR